MMALHLYFLWVLNVNFRKPSLSFPSASISSCSKYLDSNRIFGHLCYAMHKVFGSAIFSTVCAPHSPWIDEKLPLMSSAFSSLFLSNNCMRVNGSRISSATAFRKCRKSINFSLIWLLYKSPSGNTLAENSCKFRFLSKKFIHFIS